MEQQFTYCLLVPSGKNHNSHYSDDDELLRTKTLDQSDHTGLVRVTAKQSVLKTFFKNDLKSVLLGNSYYCNRYHTVNDSYTVKKIQTDYKLKNMCVNVCV